MESLLIAVAKLLPEDELLDQLEKSLKEYRTSKTEEKKSKLFMDTILLSTRFGTEKKDLMETITEMERGKKLHETFSTDRKQ